MERLDAITFQVLWSRLISIADEMARTLVRTAFSPAVTDGQDYACALYDHTGRILAQSTQCTPGLIHTMPTALRKYLEVVPAETLVPGDVLICNDPWIGSGHTPDVYVATPFFRGDALVGFAMTGAHHIDMGGRVYSPESKEVFEEGLIIPPMHLMKAGEPNAEFWRLLERNVRLPDKVFGDLRGQMAANNVGGRRVIEMIEDRGLASLFELGEQIVQQTEVSMRQVISDLPDGTYHHVIEVEEHDPNATPLKIVTAVTIEGDTLAVDFEGTSPQVDRPINGVLNYTIAHTMFGLKSALHPHLPNNDGVMLPITITAPEGSVLNARFPAPVMLRSSLAYYPVEAMYGALADVAPERVIASSGTCPLWILVFSGRDAADKPFVYIFWGNGGRGASHDRDGVNAVAFPANTTNSPAELFESTTPLIVESKEFLPDTAGPGRFRGGASQRIRVRNAGTNAVTVSAAGDHYLRGPAGLAGGHPGSIGRVQVDDREPITHQQTFSLAPGEALTVDFPGGGGYGDPFERDPDAVVADVRRGYLTVEGAAQQYGVVIGAGGSVDVTETTRMRQARALGG